MSDETTTQSTDAAESAAPETAQSSEAAPPESSVDTSTPPASSAGPAKASEAQPPAPEKTKEPEAAPESEDIAALKAKLAKLESESDKRVEALEKEQLRLRDDLRAKAWEAKLLEQRVLPEYVDVLKTKFSGKDPSDPKTSAAIDAWLADKPTLVRPLAQDAPAQPDHKAYLVNDKGESLPSAFMVNPDAIKATRDAWRKAVG